MKRLVLTIAALLLSSSLFGQTVVSKASRLTWDDPNAEGVATYYRVYTQSTPGVVPDGTSYVAQIDAPVKEWIISSGHGSWHAVVTLVNDDGVTIVETEPSNEVHYIVPGPPTDVTAIR